MTTIFTESPSPGYTTEPLALRLSEGLGAWLPIETAPRCFSPPISFNNHHAPDILGLWGQSFYCVCSWGGPSQPYWIDGNNRKIAFQPTHWMPLPAPPQAPNAELTGPAGDQFSEL